MGSSIRRYDLSDRKFPDVVRKCLHCGNETLMYPRGDYSWTGEDDQFFWTYVHILYECPVCHMATLVQRYNDITMPNYAYHGDNAPSYEERIVYPGGSYEHKSIPQSILTSFESARKVQNIDPNIAMMAFRRTLELILKDKGATGNTIQGKIEELAYRGVLPPTLKEVSDTMRILGNNATHDVEPVFAEHDVDTVGSFVGYLLDYLYVLPSKLKEQQERLAGLSKDAEQTSISTEE